MALVQIDEMDIGFYLELLEYQSTKEKNKQKGFIDDIVF
jgi:hypothetical protein